MKRLVISLGLLLLIAGATLGNTAFLKTRTQALEELLTTAQAAVGRQDWREAEDLTKQALDQWRQLEFYLHVTLRHDDIDQILASIQEVRQYLTCPEDTAEYAAANARLLTQLELLCEAECLTLHNIH